MNLKIKVKIGYRQEQFYTTDTSEAHIIYYLFEHPEKRVVLNSGLALRGVDIQSIEPDYNATMGWNSTHELDEDDWNEIRGKGVDNKLRNALADAKIVAQMIENKPELLKLPLQEAKTALGLLENTEKKLLN